MINEHNILFEIGCLLVKFAVEHGTQFKIISNFVMDLKYRIFAKFGFNHVNQMMNSNKIDFT